MEKREKFSSRLGFILISAGCAIGLGNVWRFPYITGAYGGGTFVLMYLFFLLILGLPIVVMEFAVGRGSQKSSAMSFNVLEPKGSKWHIFRYFTMAGNFLLMMFYTTIAGWMLAYFFKMLTGSFEGADTKQVELIYGQLTSNRNEMLFWMILICVIALLICSLGLEKGVEKITKWMMTSLFLILLILVIRAVTLPGAGAGLEFYLKPDLGKIQEAGVSEAVFAAMGQSFFTLSVGAGSLAIFGSYIGKERSLAGEAVSITLLDTCVAVMAGLIIFPACFAFGVNPGQGPGLVFVTLPNVFRENAWGTAVGKPVLPLYDLRRPVHGDRRIPEHYPVRAGSVGVGTEKIGAGKRHPSDPAERALRTGPDRLVRIYRCRKEHHGPGRLYREQ